ncbi:cell division protein CrgA [Dactylosporangium sp. AC04546]|uniref:cell division protein CrgA n=1 Tax=Dactylosporangium sp. AC04546 TaxID=2862460 RepID=UPI001EDFAB9E|nr:cell division protein CrgA [Dactylosporangium sp. AC04546]WVK83934.1 cell division protein CrgA [Dactylosporangium sp. AC04546]
MPKSTVRKKKVYTPPAELRPQETVAARRRPSPVWVPALAVGFVVVGIAWLVTYYLTQGFFDVEAFSALAKLEYWNLAIGFGFLVASLAVFSKWR